MILVNPQRQGGADTVTCQAASLIAKEYLRGMDYSEVPVDTSPASLALENSVFGYTAIKKQTQSAYHMLRDASPEKLFTIGGGCDADVASILYMNDICDGDLAILWFDAHGDINAPDESETHLFYGMPVRAVLGECGEDFPLTLSRFVHPSQLLHIGGRDLDTSETAYMRRNHIQRIPAQAENIEDLIMEKIHEIGKHRIYIHFDLDVLDPQDISATPLPVPGGMKMDQAVRILHIIKSAYDVAGFGLYEYLPQRDSGHKAAPFIAYGLSL